MSSALSKFKATQNHVYIVVSNLNIPGLNWTTMTSLCRFDDIFLVYYAQNNLSQNILELTQYT